MCVMRGGWPSASAMGRDYEFTEFLDDVGSAGLEPDLLLSTWDLRPWQEDADFLVALLRNTSLSVSLPVPAAPRTKRWTKASLRATWSGS